MLRKILIGLLLSGIIIFIGYLLFNYDSSDSEFEKKKPITELNYNKEETTEIFKTVIIKRDIKPDTLINCKLIPFFPYEPEYSPDGLEAPSPPPSLKGYHSNAERLIRFFNSNEFIKEDDSIKRRFFSKKGDLEYLKSQINLSEKLTETTNLKNLFSDYNSNRTKRDGYHFYTPLFNVNGTEVYIQYDFYDGVYGDGFGIILIKENNKWKIVRTVALWIT